MRTMPANARFAVSFADLCLLLLGFFILLQARRGDPVAVADGVRTAFGVAAVADRLDLPAAGLFDPGEAVLRAGARATLARLGARAAAGHRRVRVESVGRDRDSRRFDGWELAAARVAAVARGVRAGGLDERRIDVAMPTIEGTGGGQRVRVAVLP